MSKKVALLGLVALTAGVLVGCPLLLTFMLTVENYTGQDITGLFIRKAGGGSWGNSVLEAPIAGDGVPYEISGIAYGSYDLKAVFTTPALFRFNVPFVDSNWRWIFSAITVGEAPYTTVQIIDSLLADEPTPAE